MTPAAQAGQPPHAALTKVELTARVVEAAKALGFARVGITSASPLLRGKQRLEQFLAAGYAGGMQYLAEGPRHDPAELLPGAASVIAVALSYGDRSLVPLRRASDTLAGRIARYAQGADYHIVLKQKLTALGQALPSLAGRDVASRACVDTAPLLERELAARAGLGFQGKSTLVITPGVGSYVLLGELLVDLELEPTDAAPMAGCGTCRACLDACPTAAFVGPYELDARRCISYLTIEHAGTIPTELRQKLGDRVFGCDACQEACPYNQGNQVRSVTDELARRPELETPELISMLELGAAGYRKFVRRSALRRVPRTTLQRNAAIALGNSDDPRSVPPLTRALEGNPSPIVRSHVAWALGELSRHLDAGARQALCHAAESDADPDVRNEAQKALAKSERA